MNRQLSSSKRPKPNREPGYIVMYDPYQKSLKNAFVAIVFSGICLEALLHLEFVRHKGLKAYTQKIDRCTYEEKLKQLGCNDEEIFKLCKDFRSARREVVHEKAHLDDKSFRIAQKEAVLAIALVDRVFSFFRMKNV